MSQLTFSDPRKLAEEISKRYYKQRLMVAIWGSPGSGKSTLAGSVRNELNNVHQLATEIVSMDGFHYDNAVLEKLHLRDRKGAANTFDVEGLTSLLMRLKAIPSVEIAIPIFDREQDCVKGSAFVIEKDVSIILVEGNYLLLKQSPWQKLEQYFDLTIKINCSLKTLEQRLTQRWLDLGLSQERSLLKVHQNDLLNAEIVEIKSNDADLKFDAESL